VYLPSVTTPSAHDVALLCNPQAGGRWHVLADVLDSPEAKAVHRVVTDDISNIREVLSGLAQRVKLLCIYGGDGTIHRVVDELLRRPGVAPPRLALLGGGTMNITASWCGMSRSPGENFRTVMRAYMADRLLWREVPVVAATNGGTTSYGFTFILGPLVRILERYEAAPKSQVRAALLALETAASIITGLPRGFAAIHREMEARITVDGQELPFGRYSVLFANVTGVVDPFVHPFVGERTRDSFHFLSYACSSREVAIMVPLLSRGLLPVDPRALLRPVSTWRQALLSLLGHGGLPVDPRYVNRPAREVVIETSEKAYAVDGEILPAASPRFELRLGPPLHLATLAGPLMRRLLQTDRPRHVQFTAPAAPEPAAAGR
jgi:diacylglycerol kinase family enzyme